MLSTHIHTVDEHERSMETINWSKGSLALKIAKVSISEYLKDEWKTFLLTWTTEELEDLPHFFGEIDAKKIDWRNNQWTINTACKNCKNIFENILRKQQSSWSKKLVWTPSVMQTKYSGSKIDIIKKYSQTCEICSEKECPFAAEINGFDLQKTESSDSDLGLVAPFQGHTPTALNNIAKFYWRIGNMFMCRGRETNLTKNTSPADTDPSLVFKMMKNCTLFEPLEEELDIYDQILDARNYLMHSPNQRIPNEDLEILIGDFAKFLTEFKGNSSMCQRGIVEIQKLKAANVPIIDDVQIIKRAFEIQQDAVKYDLNVKGRYGVSEYVLQGVLEINEMKSKNKDWIFDADLKKKEDDALRDSLKRENETLQQRVRDLQKKIEDLEKKKTFDADLKRRDEALRDSLRAEKSSVEFENSFLKREIETLQRRVRDLQEKIEDLEKKETSGAIGGAIGGAVRNAVGGAEEGARAGAEALDDYGRVGRVVGGIFGGIWGGIAGVPR